MARLWKFLIDSRVLVVIGITACLGILFLTAETFELGLIWAVIVALALLALWGSYWGLRQLWRRHAAARLTASLAAGKDPAGEHGKGEVAVLRNNMLQAIATIKTSKLGLTRGAAALYELPWYMIIGNPAAGKSSAVAHSGLTFPIPGSKAVQGVGGTRNCDWFFTTDGILLDTAGRYSVQDGDRAEWFSFLELLKKHRRRAPINGILIAVSVAELTAGPASASMELAKSLRTRVQELTERLGVYAPVYVVFTKADLIAGFSDFFHDAERSERDRVWGATLRYNRRSTPQDVLAFFDTHFDELHDGLKEMSLANMAGNRSARMRPGVFTFPLEFAAIRSPLRAFLSTLFEENTYQFKPVFRGFYFTSALQEGQVQDLSSKRVASRFDLELNDRKDNDAEKAGAGEGYFLLELFRKVIFADKDLVKRYTNPASARLKYAAFAVATVLLGAALGGWSWAYMGNAQLVANVQADLDKVVRLQEKRIDLQSRLEALDILQDRIEQLDQYREDQPWALSFGLYQGEKLERKLRDEYFAGVRAVMVEPVAGALEAMLAEVNANAAALDPNASAAPAAKPGQPYQQVSPTNVPDAYNALKTYLMLGDKSHAEPGHLNDQLTRYWRTWLVANRGSMPHEQMIRSAERLLTFHLAQIDDQAWPQVTLKLSLLDAARENLRRVVRGTPARERVYADIKTRAATRFPAVTVARIVGDGDSGLVAGSHAVSGAFTRAAWDKYVQGAIRDASNRELQSTDWVLKTVAKDDLTLEGSPEQIQKTLVDMYKADYAREWARFVQGVTVTDLRGFEGSVVAMNRLGDPQASPIARLLKVIYDETSWDNPAAARANLGKTERTLAAWFKEVVLRRAPADARTLADAAGPLAMNGQGGMGPIGREFAGVARLVGTREKEASLMTGYLDCLSRLRTRLNQLKNQGDPGPGAKQFMQQTLEGSGSELADALKYVDEQMLTGMSDAQKAALRPLLVRPLVQTFAMIVLPSESEINKTWQAQVLEPFEKTLADKYPFSPSSKMEATSAEIGQVFGPEGVVAKFINASMGPLVINRGSMLTARTWADIGITLAPQAVSGFPGWVAPLSSNGVAPSNGGAPQTVFQLQAHPAPGATEYTIDIDGQQLRYRNTPPVWTNMVYPGPGTAGARISAVTFDGRTVELFNEPGQFGMRKMIEASTQQKKSSGVNELRWVSGNLAIVVDLRLVSNAASAGNSKGFQGLRLPTTIVGRPVAEPTIASLPAGGQ
ncbi:MULTISPECIES: type VI secretion system membrane subunit TssM [unclassified Massilia]|uniref:type VI secretion system membrane subunit TssM n=1 Tax=unclassified Massilia TaxID=2609279 RepID=UPI001786E37A|nr:MULTISPECIES: type VI secretion system membrane subunit TssM [unclassified Massilia]MBD8531166.1 type VI secretion system membrane subunit TssM [Massilia sp. CFBP 13647]MBD8675002.1 type VI secretion system membrane subunit TssM [Massilia sp. CFBP 13721]